MAAKYQQEKNKINYSLKALIENIKLRIFYLEKSSISKALNLCISKSNCEWICRMDADDKMLSNRISSSIIGLVKIKIICGYFILK